MRKQPVVLLVEDSPTQSKEITVNLKNHGYVILDAEDGLKGLQMVYDHRPDMVVLDVNLPVMDGYQVCRRIKRDPLLASTPVILLTSEDSSDATLDGLAAGADDYIFKDVFAADNLIKTLQSFQLLANAGQDEGHNG
jgi:CheY-like chemotaxis protein